MKSTRWERFVGWLRRLAPFGFMQETFGMHHQVLFVWSFGRTWHETWRWPAGTGSVELDEALDGLPLGSSERYRRIQSSAVRVYKGPNFRAAMDARFTEVCRA